MNDQIKQLAERKLITLSRAIVGTIHEFPDATSTWQIFVAMNVAGIPYATFADIAKTLYPEDIWPTAHDERHNG